MSELCPNCGAALWTSRFFEHKGCPNCLMPVDPIEPIDFVGEDWFETNAIHRPLYGRDGQ